jgi:hypothetical protein
MRQCLKVLPLHRVPHEDSGMTDSYQKLCCVWTEMILWVRVADGQTAKIQNSLYITTFKALVSLF